MNKTTTLLPSLILLLVGCQATPVTTPHTQAATKPSPVHPPPVTRDEAPTDDASLFEAKIRQQAQYIEALISQNDALTAKLQRGSIVDTSPLPPALPPPAELPPSSPPTSPDEPVLAPNADGVIDLVAVSVSEETGEPVNPFTIRSISDDAVREVTVKVGGIIAGPVACAVINEQFLKTGEAIESLTIERIDPNAVFLRHGHHRIRLPVSEQSVRVRLPL